MSTRRPDQLLLSIDCGTQSVRALLIDLHGHIVGKAQVHFDDYAAPHPGWLEHDVNGFWHATAEACQKLWAHHGHLRPALRGVAVTTQRGTVMPVDRQGQPLHPAISWLDQRAATRLPPIHPLWRAAFRALGVTDTIRYFQRQAEVNWIVEHHPEVWARTHKLLLLSGWLNWKLTGRYVDSIGSQVGYLPFDFRHQRWAARWDWKWQAMTIDPEQLPELLPVGAQLGEITAQAALDTGIPAGLPVMAAAADKACEVLGAGCIEPHVGGLSYGTTATINVTSKRYVEALPLVPPYPAALPEHYSSEVQIFRGYWMVRWFKEQFGHHERMAAEQAGIVPEALFDELVATVPPGSMGLMLQPYWSPGIRHPGPDAKGAIIGFGDVHTRAHVYRAILEGLAYALRDGRERIEKKTKVPITELRVSGGGSQSDAAMQLTADIFNLPVGRPHTFETSGLGAAIDSAVGLGLHADFATAVRSMTRVERVFEPIAAHADLYDALYGRVYRHMYDRLAPLYGEIQRITGYPKRD
ncbi:FGGY-family carbohydrate kinase [Aquabacterium sp.]|uniref:FGGY-family carbohydrate kinase n=1 Tax=Aquabacterium sp. TaxID=1872578 RepID=UPI0035B2CE62